MIVVADTSPIDYLVWIGEIEILPRLYGRIPIPASVYSELNRATTPGALREWIAELPDWLEAQSEIQSSSKTAGIPLKYSFMSRSPQDQLEIRRP
jgi:predicted nucleic acid-binding protein